MKEIVFLLEESSAKFMLQSLLPRVLQNTGIHFRCIPFEGKQDLEKQLVRKIRAYQHQARFIVLRDQDSHPDCRQVKENLLDLCDETGKADKCRVRIACRELEAFYLADLQAVEQALGITGISGKQHSSRFRSPDQMENPSAALQALTQSRYQKVSGSREIGRHLNPDNEQSPSFRNLITAIRNTERELLDETGHEAF